MEMDSQEWGTATHSEGEEGHQESNMERYGHKEDGDEENKEQEQEMEDQSWDPPQGNDNVEMTEEGMEDENQWYEDCGEEEEGGEEEGEHRGGGPNEDWDPDNEENDQQEWEDAGQQDEVENTPANEEMWEEEPIPPIPAPHLAPIRPGRGEKGSLFAPLNTGKGKGGLDMGSETIGHPTP